MINSLLKKNLMALVLLTGAASASAADRLYMDPVNIMPGESAELTFNLDNAQVFYGFQIDVSLPAGLEFDETGGSCITPSPRIQGFMNDYSFQTDGSLRITAFSLSREEIAGDSGPLLYANVKASDDFEGGDVNVTNIILTDADTQDVRLPDYSLSIGTESANSFYIPDFRINVGEKKTISIILDNETGFTAFQTDIYMPEGLSVVDRSFKMTDRGTSGHSVQSSVQGDGSIRLLAFSLKNETFSGNSGALVTFDVTAGETAAESSVIELRNQVFTTPDNKTFDLDDGMTVVTVERAMVEQILLTPASVTLLPGGNATIQAEVLPEYASNKSLQWQSSNPNVVTVTQTGYVEATGVGTAVITAAATDGSGISSACEVTVSPMPVTGIVLSQQSVTLKETESVSLTATVTPPDATDKSVAWVSGSPGIAMVNENGTVTAIKAGVAVISAVSESNPEVTAACEVTVVPMPVSGITLSARDAAIKVGEELSLKAEVTPQTASNKVIEWTSSDLAVASVSDSGVVRGISVGTAVITAKATDGSGVSTTCSIDVVPTPTVGIAISCPSTELKAGESVTLTAVVEPADATDKTVTWTTSDEMVATVSQEGTVTAIGVGTVTITARNSGGQTDSVNISVIETEAKSISIIPEALTLNVGGKDTLVAKILPETTTNKNIAWSSADPAIASVNASGEVTALSIGTTTVTATTVNGISAACTVTVAPTDITEVVISYEGTTVLEKGDVVQLYATVLPDDATDKTIAWSVTDPRVLAVDSDGKVTAIGLGEATVVAAASNGVSASVTFTVMKTPVASITLTPDEAMLSVGESVVIKATVLPDNATDPRITWSSLDTSVATVSPDGEITAVAPGTTEVVATAADGSGVTGNVKVTVAAPDVVELTLSANAPTTLHDGETLVIGVSYEPANAAAPLLTWTSSDEAIASVEEGTVTAHAKTGNATITATAENGVSASIEITVEETPAQSVLLKTAVSAIAVGETVGIMATVLPETTTDKNLTWSTSDSSVLEVKDGIVRGVAPGAAYVMATTANGVTGSLEITVEPLLVEKITLNLTAATMKVGEETTLIAQVTPADATNGTVEWTSSNVGVVTVYDGHVTAVGPGEAVVRALATDGSDVYAECGITVTQPVIAIMLNETDITLHEGQAFTLAATVSPDDASDKAVKWSTSDENVATVEDGVVTAVNVGHAVITATASNGMSATCGVTVEGKVIGVSGITLNKTDATLSAGESLELSATITPDDATDKTVTWSSSDEKVATVNENGIVTAIAAGESVITATASNGVSATCTVTVVVPVTAIELNATEATIERGATRELTATITPDDATDKTVTWSSSNEEVATVNENGIVTAIAAGEAVITAAASNGVSATCTVTVIVPVTAIELNETEKNLEEGEEFKLSVTVIPDDATEQEITWSSSDPEVASVEDGLVTAISEGEAVITAAAPNGIKAECKVTVRAKFVLVEAIEFENYFISAEPGHTEQIYATVLPENATNPVLEWTSSNEDVATVDQNGLVTIVSVGSAEIKATATDGSGVSSIAYVDAFSGIEALIEREGAADIYTVNGLLIKKNADREFITNLAKGIYILKISGKTYKVMK